MLDKNNSVTSQLFLREINFGDLDHVAQVHKKAFSSSLLSQFSPDVIKKYYSLQISPPNKCYPLGVFHEDALIGFCFGGEFRDKKLAFIKATWFQILTTLVLKPSILFSSQNRQRMITIINSVRQKIIKKKTSSSMQSGPKSRRFGILSIAVDPAFQGMGAGKLLATQTESLAIKQGFDKISLNVHVGNDNSVRFYESLGYEKILDTNANWHGIMVKALELGSK